MLFVDIYDDFMLSFALLSFLYVRFRASDINDTPAGRALFRASMLPLILLFCSLPLIATVSYSIVA